MRTIMTTQKNPFSHEVEVRVDLKGLLAKELNGDTKIRPELSAQELAETSIPDSAQSVKRLREYSQNRVELSIGEYPPHVPGQFFVRVNGKTKTGGFVEMV